MENLIERLQSASIFIAPLVLIGILFVVNKLQKAGKLKSRPHHFSHDGYYEVARGFKGEFTETALFKRPVQGDDYFYLRSVPFDIEVIIDGVAAANGRRYRARAVVSVYLPHDKIQQVVEKYYTTLYLKGYCDSAIDADLTAVLEGVLEGVMSEYDGEKSVESMKKDFIPRAMEVTLLYGHLVSGVSALSFAEIKERTE